MQYFFCMTSSANKPDYHASELHSLLLTRSLFKDFLASIIAACTFILFLQPQALYNIIYFSSSSGDFHTCIHCKLYIYKYIIMYASSD